MIKPEIRSDIDEIKDSEKIDDVVRKMIILDGFTKETVSNVLKSKTETNEKISMKYLRYLNFKKLDLVDAYRKLASFLFITGDCQDVDVIHERFCNAYCEHNPDSLTPDQCHTLVTAFIMLNSDLHSKKVSNKMTADQFITNTQNAFLHHEFDYETLKNIYKSVKQKEIKHMHKDVRVRKRSNETDTSSTVDNKKTRNDAAVGVENIRNFGFQVVKMRSLRSSAFQLFENKSWKQYFSSVNNLTLSLYKHDDFRHFYMQEQQNAQSANCRVGFNAIGMQFIQVFSPIEELQLHHAFAVPSIDDNRKCELFLIDNSRYLFKVKEAMHAENWAYSINYAASLLSKPPLWTVQNDDNTRTIIQHKWSADISKLSFKEQRERTERQMKLFEDDLIYLSENPSKKSDYKANLKYVSKNFERYKVYNRTLDMAKCNFLQVIPSCSSSSCYNHGPSDEDIDNYLSTWTSSNNLESSTSSVYINSASRMPSSSITSLPLRALSDTDEPH